MKWKPLNGASVKHSETSTLFQRGKPSYPKFIKSRPPALFARYCFIRALAEDPTFDLKVHVEKEIFFTES